MTLKDYERELEKIHDNLGSSIWCSPPSIHPYPELMNASSLPIDDSHYGRCALATDQLVDGRMEDVSLKV